MALGVETGALLSLFLELILYGLFVFLFALSCYVTWDRHRRNPSSRQSNIRIMLVLGTMFLIATLHVGASINRILEAFVWSSRGNGPTMPADVLNSINIKIFIVRLCAYEVQILLGDAFMIYRLYMVWCDSRLICIPPILTFIASIGVSVMSLWQSALTPTSPQALHLRSIRVWHTSFICLTMFTNGCSTLLIAAKIWYEQRKINMSIRNITIVRDWQIGQAALIIIESAAVYSVSLVVLLTLYEVQSHAADIPFDCIPQIVGIVFSFIIIRVAAGVSPLGSPTGDEKGETRDATSMRSLIFRHSSKTREEGTLGPDIAQDFRCSNCAHAV